MTTPNLYIPRRREIVLPGERCRRCGRAIDRPRPARVPHRRPSRWRRTMPLRMAGNALQIGADGAARVKDDGLVVAGDTDACCCTSSPTQRCDYCEVPDAAPVQFHVTFAGVQFCLLCGSQGGFVTTKVPTAGTFSGTYTITRETPDPAISGHPFCRWSTNVPYTAMTRQVFFDFNCNPVAYDHDDTSTFLLVQYLRVHNFSTGNDEYVLNASNDFGTLFSQSGLGTALPCAGGTVSNNNSTPCAHRQTVPDAGAPWVGGDGTATLTPV